MGQAKQYDKEYKEQAVKLAEEKDCKAASDELGVPYGTLYGWKEKARIGELRHYSRTSAADISMEEEMRQLRQANKELTKENKRLAEENEFLTEATAFFAASRQRSAKKKE